MTATDTIDLRERTTPRRLDAHWYAAEGVAAAVVHAMLVQPAAADIDAALEADDPARAVASAIECLRWTSASHAVLAGRGSPTSSVEVDLLIAASGGGGIDAIRTLSVEAPTRADAEHAAAAATDAEADLRAALPVALPVRRTPTGYQPANDVVSQLERLRHRLGLPLFEWEAWVG